MLFIFWGESRFDFLPGIFIKNMVKWEITAIQFAKLDLIKIILHSKQEKFMV